MDLNVTRSQISKTGFTSIVNLLTCKSHQIVSTNTGSMAVTFARAGILSQSTFRPAHEMLFNSLPAWEILHALLSSADFFQNQLFGKNYFSNTVGVSTRLDLDQA